MAAWHMRRLKDNPEEKSEDMPTGILSRLARAEIHLTREYLEIIARDMATVPGVELVHDKPKGYKPPDMTLIKAMEKSPEEYEKFDQAMKKLVKVSKHELDAMLEKEKAAKDRKAKRTSSSDRASRERH
jgi:hypothetical protein